MNEYAFHMGVDPHDIREPPALSLPKRYAHVSGGFYGFRGKLRASC
jgi:hypothetical protein